SFGSEKPIAAAERARARTWCPASSACRVFSSPMPLLAPMINTRATLVLHVWTARIAPAIIEQMYLRPSHSRLGTATRRIHHALTTSRRKAAPQLQTTRLNALDHKARGHFRRRLSA